MIRGEIGFDGLLMTDDLSMKALRGDFDERAAAALAAGCDVVLHCNGDMAEMAAVAAAAAALAGRSRRRRADRAPGAARGRSSRPTRRRSTPSSAEIGGLARA